MLHFIYRLWGHTDYYADNDSGKFATIELYHWDFGNLAVDFVWDPLTLGQWLQPTQLAEYDVIISSSGAWAGMAGETVDWYRENLEAFCERIETAYSDYQPDATHNQTRIFLTAPPYPPLLTGNSVSRRDQRTNPKASVWRDTAEAVVSNHGWRVVDQFDRAMPVMLEMLASDGLHLSPGPSHTSIVDEVIAKAGLC
ncbi:MAG: hypothetical protein TREMPRED_005000 [Tremellales sp. Tagirdzhanova-0007]|nr:MAG: hypothetical protein TREMPRED_005000 [Tremellales sp. Tagirdzhanova-0007]